MTLVVIGIAALLASVLTFLSGFGLGTLLLPVLLLFVQPEEAIALTAVVHLLNGLFKVALTSRHTDWRVARRFGIPAALAAVAGAVVLLWLTGLRPLAAYALGGRQFEITPVKLIIGLLLLAVTLIEFLPRFRSASFDLRWLPLGGVMSGFFGGLSGHQGALRAAFLMKAGLSKEGYIATGAVISAGIDLARLALYAEPVLFSGVQEHGGLLAAAVAAALAGALIGNHFLKHITMKSLQVIVAVLLILISLGLAAGLL